MQRNRAMAMLFLLGALLTGGALGFAGTRVFAADRPPVVQWGNQRSMRAYVAKRLDLSPDQQAQMDSILDERYRAMRAAMDPVRPRMDSIRLASRARMRALLSPAQQAAFDQLVAESEARRDSARAADRR
jgi:Spy/CpxP family protein refolding chaperone